MCLRLRVKLSLPIRRTRERFSSTYSYYQRHCCPGGVEFAAHPSRYPFAKGPFCHATNRIILLSSAVAIALIALTDDGTAHARRHRRFANVASRSYRPDYRDRLVANYVRYRDDYLRTRPTYQPVSYQSGNARLLNEPIPRSRYAQAVPTNRPPRQQEKPPLRVIAPGYITPEQAQGFKASGQTPRDLIRQFGPPDRSGQGYVAWNIAGTSDGIIAPQSLIVHTGGGGANSAYFFGGLPR